MGKAKVLKILKGAEDVAGAIPRATATSGGRQQLTGMDLFKQSENPAPTPSPRGVDDEIVQQTASQSELRRMQQITNPRAEPNSFYQTVSPEEFKTRYNKQLKNPDYMARNSNPFQLGVDAGEIGRSQGFHIKQRNDIFHGLNKNPRWKQRYQEWVGESAYKDEIMFHIDRQTDPTRPNSFIQFEEPKEFGLHAGTSRASEGVIGYGGIEGAGEAMGEIANRIDELAGFLMIPEKQLHSIIAREVEAHFQKRFTSGELFTSINTDEWQEIVDSLKSNDVFQGPELTRANGIIRTLKEMPMPNSTPMVFRGQNGLLLVDHGGFRTDAVADQLRMIFPDDADLIDAARGARGSQAQKNLQEFIESKGYDHIVYHNSVEDKGSLSIINWNPDLQRSLYDADFAGVNPRAGSAVATQAFMGMLGLGGTGAALQSDK